MTLSDVKIEFQTELHNIYPKNEISAIYTLLLSDIGYSKTDTVLHATMQITSDQITFLRAALKQLSQHIPIQYIRGKADFYGLEFRVNQHVLIPRQETELLVHSIISNPIAHTHTILDVGTGSGCIAITIAKYIPQAQVFALDISSHAIEIARKNAQDNSVNITCIEADMCNEQQWNLLPTCSILVSNPPYVCSNEKKQMKAHVLDYEPHLALFAPDHNPLLYYDALARMGLQKLEDRGMILCEINEAFGNETCSLFSNAGYKQCKIIQDLHSKDRFIQAYKH